MAATIEAIDERFAILEARVAQLEEAVLRPQPRRIGVTVEEARAMLGQPVERGPEQLARFERIIGSFEGPEDLSSRMREYLWGERE